MKCTEKCIVLFLIITIILSSDSCLSANQDHPDDGAFQTAEGVVSEIYKLVSFEKGTTPDWEKVKSLFIDDAVIVLRTSRDSMTVLSKQGFVDLFIHDIEKYQLDEKGFKETVISTKTTVFGNIAHCFTVYEVSVLDGSMPPMRGVDSFQLMEKNGRWYIVAITNEIPRPDNPIPEEFLK